MIDSVYVRITTIMNVAAPTESYSLIVVVTLDTDDVRCSLGVTEQLKGAMAAGTTG